MLTLKKIAALHIEQINGGDASKDSQSSYQIVIPRIRHILNDFIKPLINERYNDDDKTVPTNFLVTYDFTVQNDALGAYVDLTESYLSLPHNRGIKRAFQRMPVESQPGAFSEYELIPTEFPEFNRNTRAGRYPTHRKYYMEGLRLRLQNISAEPGQTNKVYVQQVVAAPDSFGENDPLPLSPEMISQVLLKLMAFVPPAPQDKINNQNPTPNQ